MARAVDPCATPVCAVVCVLMLMLICFISRVARDLASVNARLVVLEDLAVRKPSHVRNERSHLMKYDSQWGTCNPLRTVTQSVPVDYARAHEVTPEAHTACAV